MIRYLFLLFVITVAGAAIAQPLERSYPFTIPQSDTAATGLLPTIKPAVPISSRLTPLNGHFYRNAGTASQERVRLFGVDLLYSAAFPDRPHAQAMAKHLHKLGFNAVRLYYNDYNSGLCYTDANSSYNVNPGAFAILDSFIYEMKQQGIYVFFTLHSVHSFSTADGIIHADSGFVPGQGWFKEFYNDRTAELYRQWAKAFLGHMNPVTGMRLADDPAVASIELNNQEYSLFLACRNT